MDESYARYLQTMQGYANQQFAYAQNQDTVNHGYDQLYAQQAGYGASQYKALQQDYDRQLATSQQSMLSRGLGNTTVLDSAARGINYDRANSQLTVDDQLYQRQNAIKQQQLGFQAQSGQYMAGLKGQENSYLGTVQQANQSQGFQANQAQNQFNNQLASQREQQTYGYNQQASAQNNQLLMQKRGFDQANYTQREFGYYADGGMVPGYGTAHKPAMIQPGEFVLSKDHIADLLGGKMSNEDLRRMIQMGAMQNGQAIAPASGVSVYAQPAYR